MAETTLQRKPALLGKTKEELTNIALELGLPKFTGNQLAQWLYVHRAETFDRMTNLSKKARSLLAEYYTVGREKPVTIQTSADGTRKYLFPAIDVRGEQGWVEAVMIPEGDRATLCISSQIGCKMNCLFCMTGKQGWRGNLTAGEIINQVLSVEEADKLTNIVFMGMGEPLDNVEQVLRSIEILTSEWGLAWSPKRITLSTIGVRAGLIRFLNETRCHLAVSLHNPFAQERAQIMPVENSMPLKETLSLIRSADFSSQRRVSFEYIVFEGVNDSLHHAEELTRLLRDIPCRINLIRFHKIPDVELNPVNDSKMEAFRAHLEKSGFTATIRASRGEDISAACGMLSTREKLKQQQ